MEELEGFSDHFIVEPFQPRLLVNSFPKSGTHLALLIAVHLVRGTDPMSWCGSFRGNSFTLNWFPLGRAIRTIKRQYPGTFMLGHMAWRQEFEDALQEMNTCKLFVYRDLRDVAVSQTYHIEHEDSTSRKHPNKQVYWDMPSHEDRLIAVIEGIPNYPGIFERWQYYKPWLEKDWVLPLYYQDMLDDPKKTAEDVILYMIKRHYRNEMIPPILAQDGLVESIEKSIENQKRNDLSASYRKGGSSWREEFTPRVMEVYERCKEKYESGELIKEIG